MSFVGIAAIAGVLAVGGALLVWLADKLDRMWLKPVGTLVVMGAVLFVMRADTSTLPQQPLPPPTRAQLPLPSGSPETPGVTPSPSESADEGDEPAGGAVLSPLASLSEVSGLARGGRGSPTTPTRTKPPKPTSTPTASPTASPSPSGSPSPSPSESPSPDPSPTDGFSSDASPSRGVRSPAQGASRRV